MASRVKSPPSSCLHHLSSLSYPLILGHLVQAQHLPSVQGGVEEGVQGQAGRQWCQEEQGRKAEEGRSAGSEEELEEEEELRPPIVDHPGSKDRNVSKILCNKPN